MSTSIPNERTTSAQLHSTSSAAVAAVATDKPIRIQGLVRSIRKQKRIAFAHVADGTTSELIHAVLNPEQARDIQTGSYVDMVGRWEESPGKGQSHDLQVESIKYIGKSEASENPIQKKATTVEFLRSVPHLRMRTNFGSLVVRTRSELIKSVADYFGNVMKDPAVQVHPPAITSSDCEGAGEVFTIAPRGAEVKKQKNNSQEDVEGSSSLSAPSQEHFFGEPKYLTVSSQLHLEAWSAELGNVWTLSPTFRAEFSDTVRHLAEFYMLEAEFRGTDHLGAVIDHAEHLIRHVVTTLSAHRVGKELLSYYDNVSKIDDVNNKDVPDLSARWAAITSPDPWPRITYATAIEHLSKAYNGDPKLFQFKPDWSSGLSLEHERWLVANVTGDSDKTNNTPLVVTDYPSEQKPFYMLPNDALDQSTTASPSSSTVACFDILLPHGYAEVCGGSLREHRLENLIEGMRLKGLLTTSNTPSANGTTTTTYPHLKTNESLGSLQWYADLRRFGTSPHGGFGIGFDRLLAYIVGVNNVRDVVGFPRAWGRGDC